MINSNNYTMRTKFNGIFTLLLVFFVQLIFAQQKTVSGTISDESGPLPGVTVMKKGTTQGTETNFDGEYSINTKVGDILVFSFVGLKTEEVVVGESNNITLVLQNDNFLEEIIVTGVATGTSTKKLGFTVSKVDGDLLEEVPAANASNALRGKVAGINIFQTQGDGSATVSLRGAKSVFGNSTPLILIDGIITNQSLGDINTQDIESIEIVKGAAASSMYGSRAAGGVIQILTKKGKRGEKNTTVTFRTEVGFNTLERRFPTSTKHPYLTNPDGTLILNSSGQAQTDPDGLFDGDFNTTGLPAFDIYKNGLTEALYINQTLSLSGGGENFNYYISSDFNKDGGLVKIIDADKRSNLRANFDFSPNEKLSIGIRTSYTRDKWNTVTRGGRSSFWGSLLTFAPFVDVLEKDADGDYLLLPTGSIVQNIGSVNPWYRFATEKRERSDDRFVAGLNLDYNITDNLQASGSVTMDKYYFNDFRFRPIGYKTTSPDPDLNRGRIIHEDTRTLFSTASASLKYEANLSEKLKSIFTAKYLLEHQERYNKEISASGLTTANVYDIEKSDKDRRSMESTQSEINAQNYFLSADFDFQDKLILSGLIRRDGSSLFGANQRWQTYYRGSLAYRLTQDVSINNVQELKLRASYGTAGRRPGFSYQYEIANVDNGEIDFDQSGNPDLKPSENRELEFGVDVSFLDRFNLAITYSKSTIKNDFINRELPKSISTFGRQWQNLGSVDANTFEFYLEGKVVQSESFNWKFGLAFDSSRSEITDLGDLLPYSDDQYRIETGKEVGTIYGNWAFKSISEINFDENGVPTNIYEMPNGITKNDLVVNNMGYVVVKSTIGTPEESVLMAQDDSGQLDVREIGRNTPDFKLGLTNTLKYKDFGLYFLLDYKHGGDTYNASTQDLLYQNRSSLQSIATEKGHHSNFAGNSSVLYNGNNYSSAFVENSTYLKVREIALSYNVNKEALGNVFKDVKLSLVGRNLFTFTDYTGANPESSYEYYSSPLYRTFSTALILKF